MRHTLVQGLVRPSPLPSALPTVVGRRVSSLTDIIARDTFQSYVSSSTNPFVNLSFEHHLLQTTPPHSAVLFLHVNRPCVVIGRNQNPWAEVNLLALRAGISPPNNGRPAQKSAVDLVRRRSGGGAVFHDTGNVNWTVISPAKDFTRDKHVEMIVQALRALGVDRARVNKRHDIVLDMAADPSCPTRDIDPLDSHRTCYTVPDSTQPGQEGTVKISGSAYKLTRGRALHHGTCLLQSPHIGKGGALSRLLHAPGQGVITAKGVESVRSPVANADVQAESFMRAVRQVFSNMYSTSPQTQLTASDMESIASVREGMREMLGADWIFGQTPHFSLSVEGESNLAMCETKVDAGTSIFLEVKHSEILGGKIILPDGSDVFSSVKGLKLSQDWNWKEAIASNSQVTDHNLPTVSKVVDLLDVILPTAKKLDYF